jgi:hypothetical protein
MKKILITIASIASLSLFCNDAFSYNMAYPAYPYFLHPDLPWRIDANQDVPVQFMVRFRDLNFGIYLGNQ